MMDASFFTAGNKDDLHAAIDALNAFTKSWCMNCEKTEEQDDLVFRCEECPFLAHGEDPRHCMIKKFGYDRDPAYMLEIDFGCMGVP